MKNQIDAKPLTAGRPGLLTEPPSGLDDTSRLAPVVASTDEPGPRLPDLLQEQALLSPDAIAVVDDRQHVSYFELNRRSNQLAHYLKRQAVGPETGVGVFIERSPELIMAVLAVLKAGGYYIPMDPTYPKERLLLMMRDSDLSIVVTQQSLLNRLDFEGKQVTVIDGEWEKMACESQDDLAVTMTPDEIALLIYTSGSSGTPKGVMLRHRSLVEYIKVAAERYGIGPGDRVLQFGSISFDLSAEEMYTCLTRGATLVLRWASMLDSIPSFLEGCRHHALTVLSLPTTFWVQLIRGYEIAPFEFPSSIKQVVIGGDRVPPDNVTLWQRTIGKRVSLINTYGPTEATIAVTMDVLSKAGEALPDHRQASIGYPIEHCRIYVLDDAHDLAPAGTNGEIFIGGLLLARGYIGRPDLTGDRFVPDPFSDKPGARMYGTGDRGRFLDDGCLEFLGRLDQQIKVRGYRVELGEIEATLRRHGNVRDVVVIASTFAQGDKKLVAYIVPKQSLELSTEFDTPNGTGNHTSPERALRRELFGYLKQELPDYMHPASLVFMTAFPMLPSGKVDRKALPPAEEFQAKEASARPRAMSPTEEILAAIWSDVLETENLEPEDEFFEAGGNSLLATIALAQVLESYQVKVSLKDLFDHPILRELAQLIDQKVQEKAEVRLPAITKVPRSGGLPLSFAQQRLWYLDQLSQGNKFYNYSVAILLDGRLNVPSLNQGLREVLHRHEALRTVYTAEQGEALQFVKEMELEPALVDLTGLPATAAKETLDKLSKQEADRGFDLKTGPMLRAAVVKTADHEHWLLLTMHHIAYDGWSEMVFYREIGAVYGAFGLGWQSPLSELPFQYADFAMWQRDWLRGEVLERELDYWRNSFSGCTPVLNLPTDRPRPQVQRFNGAQHPVRLGGDTLERVKALSREEHVTVFMTLLSAFYALLFRYCGQDDIVVGTPIANRTRTEIDGIIGFFVNTLALRADLSGDPTYVDFLDQVKNRALGGYAHQDAPFEKVIEAVHPERDLSRSPLFQVMFVLQNVAEEELHLRGLKTELRRVPTQAAKFDLILEMAERRGTLIGWIEYDTDLFESATIERMFSHFEVLLNSILENPERRLSAFDILTEPERDQLLIEWNRTETDYSSDATVHELFEEQVRQRPDAIAVIAGEDRLSYGALNAKADDLARRLRDAGVGPQESVGVCLGRGPEMVWALVGILKAGAAYLPLDPTYPEERIQLMLEDGAVRSVVTTAAQSSRIDADKYRLVYVDAEEAWPARQSDEVCLSLATAGQAAYVIYTSGSTGTPKGIAVPHRAIVRLVRNTNYVTIRPDDRIAQISTSTFDAATFEIWGALTNGASLVIIGRDISLSPARFEDYLREERITSLFLTTALFNETARNAPAAFRGVRDVLFGGEAVDPKCVAMVMQGGAPDRLLHVYGPTENTTFSSWHKVEQLSGREATVPIGCPVSNTQIYVLDAAFHPVPVGAFGELCLAGDGLALGYLNRPDQTAERFIPNLFDDRGGRLYRTGDIVRYQADGNIVFVGRQDHQIKIRGFRVELGEIEAALIKNEKVNDAVVLADQDAAGSKRLVGYVARKDSASLTPEELRLWLKRSLPAYMIPAAFVITDKIPLTASGKVDRRALPAPEEPEATSDQRPAAPRSPIEEMVSQVLAEVLGVPKVAADADFFSLGGHSLLATRVISRVRNLFKVSIALDVWLMLPTVQHLSGLIEEALREGRQLSELPIKRTPRPSVVPPSSAQRRLWFLDQLSPNNPFYNIPDAYRLRGSVNVATLTNSLNEIVRRHESLRTSFSADRGGACRQIIHEGLTLDLNVIDLCGIAEGHRVEEATRVATQEAFQPFDLSTAPLLRARLIHLSEDEHILLLTAHHIISDGWSEAIFNQELSVLYDAFSAGRPSPLPELALQYADYALWERETLKGEALKSQMEYWRDRLGDAPQTCELSADHARPAVPTHVGAALSIRLSEEDSERLKEFSRREGVTDFMALLSVFKILLFKYTGQDDLVVGSPIANRSRSEFEALIGFFVNTLALRTSFHGSPTFVECLQRVRETALGAYVHQEMPFEKVVEELRPDRDESRAPFFQTMFSLQNTPRSGIELEGISCEPLRLPLGTAKYDLVVNLWEEEGRFAGEAEYSVDLFDHSTISRLIGHFETLLAGVLRGGDFEGARQRICDLKMLSESEQLQVVVAWNDTATDYPSDQLITDLFDAQAERTLDAIAAQYDHEHLTYGELRRRANQVASYLRGEGVGPEEIVGLCLNRSLEMVVALVGILKAGAAYAPLDADYPAERLDYMVRDAGVWISLTETSLAGGLSKQGNKCVDIKKEWATISRCTDLAPAAGADAASLAYVIYTSGSSGTPKGVAVTQQAIVRLVKNTNYVTLNADDNVAQVSNASFDAATFEIWGSLLAGSRLVIIAREVMLAPHLFAQEVKRHGVTTMFLTTALFNQMSQAEPQAFEEMRAVLFGGEAVEPRWVSRVKASGSPARLLHVYGPTEAVTFSTWHEVGEFEEEAGTIPIGKPLSNTQAFVLDKHFNVVGIGIKGELCLAGDGLARGYLNRPDLTAEKFVPLPFSTSGGGRLYRTGDEVRLLSDGSIEFLGRLDNQVKIRGFRIELGEIEAALQSNPRLTQAVVLATESERGRRLVAYVVPKQGEAIKTAELKSQLKQKLPAYMVPSEFVFLDKLPLNPNGKVDRGALPAPHTADEEARSGLPTSPIEEVLCGIFADTLSVETVGTHDNFFTLGGHSLLAGLVMSRVRSAFRIELPVRSIFEAPTAFELGNKVEQKLGARAQEAIAEVTAITPVPRESPLPLSFAQQRLWFLHRLDPENPFYNMPIAFLLEGELNIEALEKSLNEIIRRHESLRTTFVEEEGQAFQIIAPTEPLSLAVEEVKGESRAERYENAIRVASDDARLPFDLSQGRLLRARLLRISGLEYLLVMVIHHIVSDGWSMGIFERELGALYGSLTKGEKPELELLPAQYADYACWQRTYLEDEVLAAQLEYWKQQLAPPLPILELPMDGARPSVQTHRGAVEMRALEAGTINALRRLSHSEGVTLYMALLACLDILLYRYTGQEDVLVGTPVANRSREEVKGLIGFFVNTLVMRVKLGGHSTGKDVLANVREAALGGYAHQDLPFEKIVEELQPDRDLSRNPLFQIMFALNDAPLSEMELSGLDIRPVHIDSGTALFDLSLLLDKGEDEIAATLQYNTDLFDASTISRMWSHFGNIVAGLIADPNRRVADLEMLSAAELRQIAGWNDTATEPAAELVIDMFEDWAAHAPDTLALQSGDEQLTYGRLNSAADLLADYLRGRGIGLEDTVGVCTNRSVEMVVALVAILKAGAAYLPLDSDYPLERLHRMSGEAAVSLVLATESTRRMAGELGPTVVSVNEQLKSNPTLGAVAPRRTPLPESLAYVIFTSGSTGKAKGVAVSHAALKNLVRWHQAAYEIKPGDHTSQIASFGFDASVWEVWPCLATGATLHILDSEARLSTQALKDFLDEQGITISFVPTPIAEVLLQEPWPAGTALRALLTGGDKLRHNPDPPPPFKLFNNYGPTENAVVATYCEIAPRAGAGAPPIGRPIDNVKTHLVDGDLNIVPTRIAGEIFIGGDSLARGYVESPDLTAERFLPDPFSEEPGARLYRTGDVGRYLPSGDIEYLGRTDRQIKLRGNRIELAEIETALMQHGAIRGAVVDLVDDGQSEKRLVAYLTSKDNGSLRSEAVCDYLRTSLPEYMVPSQIIVLENFPLTPNGKIDRNALPRPQLPALYPEGYSEPRSDIEKSIAALWREVLRLERVGVHDSFFALGGTSITILALNQKMARTFNTRIPVADMFRYPTISSMAARLSQTEPEVDSLRQAEEAAHLRRRSVRQQRQARIPQARVQPAEFVE